MTETPLKRQAYNEIKAKIIGCEYAPGALLSEEALRQEYSVSRTPIRDALSRLEQEGLIRILPKKGAQVTPLSAREVNELYEARLQIEPFAILNYASRIPDEQYQLDIAAFSTPHTETSPAHLFALDDEFHRRFIQSAGNRYLGRLYELTANQTARLRALSGCEESRLKDTQREHLSIAQRCLARDWPGAAQAMREHLIRSKDAVFLVADDLWSIARNEEEN